MRVEMVLWGPVPPSARPRREGMRRGHHRAGRADGGVHPVVTGAVHIGATERIGPRIKGSEAGIYPAVAQRGVVPIRIHPTLLDIDATDVAVVFVLVVVN